MTLPEIPVQKNLFNEADESNYLNDQIITYLGNKRALLDFIGEGLSKVKERVGKAKLRSFDVFSGSGVVSRYLKKHSSYIHSNDLERYAEITNRCYLSNPENLSIKEIHDAISYINKEASKNPSPGFISELYAPDDSSNIKQGERVFYTTRNAMFIDTARQMIEGFDKRIHDYLIAPLIYRASVNANTSGVFKGFYKNSDTGKGQFGGNGKNALSRITKDIYIPFPIFSNYSCNSKVTRSDANKIVRDPEASGFDVAYVDPPYNQHPYGSNYFMLNLIADYKRPKNISKVSGIPKNWNRSKYNKRKKIGPTFRDLISNIKSRFIMVSYNSEGFIDKDHMLSILNEFGNVDTISTEYNTFRGSRNLNQRNLYVTEYLYLLETK